MLGGLCGIFDAPDKRNQGLASLSASDALSVDVPQWKLKVGPV